MKALRILGISLWLCSAASLHGQGNTPPTGAELFEKHFRSCGGTEVADSITTVLVRGAVNESGAERKFTLHTKYPGMILLELTDSSGKFIRYGRAHDGRAWEQSAAGIRDLEQPTAGRIGLLALALSPKWQVFASERLAESISERTVTVGRPVYATGKKTAVRRLMPRFWFDADNGRLAGIGNARLADYRDVAKWALPHTIHLGAWASYSIHNVTFGVELPEKNFSRPGGNATGFAQFSNAGARAGKANFQTILSATGKLEIVRRPPPGKFDSSIRSLPQFDHHSGQHGQVDLRSVDLRKLDVSTNLTELLHADFDSRTQWPERLPPEFSPTQILERAKDPGLGIRKLHQSGITGKGVGIGIIDSPLLVEHKEYRARLRLYEELHSPAEAKAQMHGGGVTSIAAGETCGVAPGADIYYLAVQNSSPGENGAMELDYGPVGEAIERLLDINKLLQKPNRIRVISISMGWGPGSRGYEKVSAAINRSKMEGVFVISTALKRTHGLVFDGLGREATTDPNMSECYGPGFWWASFFWSGEMRFAPGKRLCVPMDVRTTASPTGDNDYTHYNTGGWSWAVPWLAGLYALACEVRPDVTPELFWSEGLRTGRTITLVHDKEPIPFGTIAFPESLLEALKTRTSISASR